MKIILKLISAIKMELLFYIKNLGVLGGILE